MTPERQAELERTLDQLSPVDQLGAAIVLALSAMERLSREQKVDIVSAALHAHRVAVMMSLLEIITDEGKQRDAEQLKMRIYRSLEKTSSVFKSTVNRFFTLTEMIEELIPKGTKL